MSSGPWIYWHDLEAACADASSIGLDGIELFTESADQVPADELRTLLDRHQLELAAVGTGAGKVFHGLSLTDPDADRRAQAVEFIRGMISFGASFGAPAIIGSMQGGVPRGGDREEVLAWLGEGLEACGRTAADLGVTLIYEPLNRYESNLLNTQADACAFLETCAAPAVRTLADLFHMNIEEVSLPDALRDHASHIGHVHFADSNRRPPGDGHTNFGAIGEALREVGYDGWVSAEAFPWPDPAAAARRTYETFREWIAER